MKLTRYRLLLCLIFFFAALYAGAQVTTPVPGFYTIQANKPLQSLQAYLLVAEDKDHVFTAADILSGKVAADFTPVPAAQNINPQSTWWCKLTLQADFALTDHLIGLQRENITGTASGNEVLEAWIIKNGRIEKHYSTGSLTPASARPVNHPFNLNLFPFSIQPGETKTILLQLRSVKNIAAPQFNFSLQHKDLVRKTTSAFSPTIIFYSGVMFILFLYGLVFSFTTRQRSFYWFTLVALFYLLHSLLLHPDNLMTQWLFPQHPVLMVYTWPLLTYINVIFYWQFGRSFAQLSKTLPAWDMVARCLLWFTGIAVLIITLLFAVAPFYSDMISRPASLIIFLTSIILSVRFLLHANPQVKMFGIAAGWLFLFQVMGVLWETGVLPEQIPNPWITAQFGTMIIIFFALANLFKRSAIEQAEARQVLEMDKIKRGFFASISHEFRTPLTLMLGPLQQLEENTTDTATQQKYFGMMRRNGERLLQLINQLLDLSKLEGGKMQLHIAKTDISGLVHSIVSSFEPLAEQKQVNFHVHFPQENIIGFADKDKIEKVLVNLLSNAFNFTAPNGTVSLHTEVSGNRLRISVQDNGAGIPKEELDNIFERFHQVPGTTGGTGIGLSLVKELVQLHKGQISVTSDPGKGSSFRINIPIAREDYSSEEMGEPVEQLQTNVPVAAFNSPAAENQEDELKYNNTLPTILVVEDNIDLQQFIQETLHKEFQTAVAGNGKAGLEKAKELVPDLVISDIMMPEMDGIEMTAQLKQNTATSHIPVIILTAKAGSHSRIEGLQTGADDYLVKPFDANELLARCSNLIAQRQKLRALFSKQVISITPDAITADAPEQGFLQNIRSAIEANLDNEQFSVVDLAAAVFMSRSQLHRKLKALTGESPNELVRNFRLERALQLLQQQGGTVTEVAFSTGFSNPSYFSKCFNDRYGYAPGEVKKRVG